jgi:cephalosporin hydroxylase
MTVLKVQNRKKITSYITSVDLHINKKKGLSLFWYCLDCLHDTKEVLAVLRIFGRLYVSLFESA